MSAHSPVATRMQLLAEDRSTLKAALAAIRKGGVFELYERLARLKQTVPFIFFTAQLGSAVQVELVSLVARPDAVPYGCCRNLLLETRAKGRISTGGSNAKMRFKKVGFPPPPSPCFRLFSIYGTSGNREMPRIYAATANPPRWSSK